MPTNASNNMIRDANETERGRPLMCTSEGLSRTRRTGWTLDPIETELLRWRGCALQILPSEFIERLQVHASCASTLTMATYPRIEATRTACTPSTIDCATSGHPTPRAAGCRVARTVVHARVRRGPHV